MYRNTLFGGLLILLIISTCSWCGEVVLDNLDNDSSLADQVGHADAFWSMATSVESSAIFDMAIDLTTYNSSPAALKIDWQKSAGNEWAHFRFTRFEQSDNVNDWTGYDGIRIDVYGEAPSTLLKLMDTDGEESGDLAFVGHTGETFDTLQWPFSTLNSCDLNKITEILVFVNGGSSTGSGTCYFDNVRLYKTGEEVLLDNFDNDSSKEDDPSNPDSKVSVNRQYVGSAVSLSIDTTSPDSSPACVKVDLVSKQPWDHFFISNLAGGSGNIYDFSEVTTLSMAVNSSIDGNVLIKLKDTAGTESGDLGFIATQVDQWTVLQWDISGNGNLGSCDLSNIQEIIVFPPAAGSVSTGAVYFDTVTVDLPNTPTPAVTDTPAPTYTPSSGVEMWEIYR